MQYIDTTVLVPFYYPDPLSDEAEEVILKLDNPVISQLTRIEFTNALATKIHEDLMTKESGNKILALFKKHIEQKSYQVLPLQPKHYSTADTWVAEFKKPFSTLEALHLVIVVINKMSIITADNHFAELAKLLGIKVTMIG